MPHATFPSSEDVFWTEVNNLNFYHFEVSNKEFEMCMYSQSNGPSSVTMGDWGYATQKTS